MFYPTTRRDASVQEVIGTLFRDHLDIAFRYVELLGYLTKQPHLQKKVQEELLGFNARLLKDPQSFKEHESAIVEDIRKKFQIFDRDVNQKVTLIHNGKKEVTEKHGVPAINFNLF